MHTATAKIFPQENFLLYSICIVGSSLVPRLYPCARTRTNQKVHLAFSALSDWSENERTRLIGGITAPDQFSLLPLKACPVITSFPEVQQRPEGPATGQHDSHSPQVLG